MYEAYFNLRVKPFELVPDPSFIFLSRAHKKAITYLDYGIRERAGFILLTGDVGSGKTTLIRNLLANHGEKIVLAKLFNTSVDSDQLLAMINDDFGLTTAGKDKITLLRDLNEFLVQQYAAGKQPVLIIDEAQNLTPQLLEEVRMLSNLETSDSKLLQIILAGQPELRSVLALPELMQLRQRISINCNLHGLSRIETNHYIRHRLDVAGNADAVKFETKTFDLIYRYSRGIPRLINIICDFLLLSAFAEEVDLITADMTMDVIGDMDFENHFWGALHPQTVSAAASVAEAQPHEQQKMQETLSTILQRIDAIEFDVKHPFADTSPEYEDQLQNLQHTIEDNRAYTDTQLKELGNKLETILEQMKPEPALSKSPEPPPPLPTPAPTPPAPRPGFFRRLLGG